MKRLLNIAFFLIVALPLLVSAQNNIYKVKIDPLNRVCIYFENSFPVYKTSISEDKLQIKIFLQNTKFADSVRSISSNGIIKNVYSRYNNKDCEIIINLQEKRGYTLASLPYSKSLIIEVFSWDKLSSDEDSYRTGLLGLETGPKNIAINDLTNSVKQGNPNSAAILGIALLQEGKINSAQKNLEFADKKASNIIDIYAALAQISQIKKLENKSYFYSKIFSDKAGIANFELLQLPQVLESDSVYLEPVWHLDSLLSLLPTINADSSNKVKTDTNLKKTTINDTTNSQKAKSNMFPWWMEFVLYGFIGIILLILYFYFKWRKDQLEIITKIKEENKKANLAQSRNPIPLKVSNFTEKYKQNELSNTKENLNSNEDLPFKKKPNVDSHTKLDIERFITQFKEKSQSEKAKIFEDNLRTPTHSVSNTAKVELAIHLAEEQQRLKDTALESLQETKFENTNNKFGAIAKSLGLEQNSIETKKNLDDYTDNKDKLNDLAKKFSIEPEDE